MSMPYLQEIIMKRFAKTIVRRLMHLMGFSDAEEQHSEPTPEDIEYARKWEAQRIINEQRLQRMLKDPKYRDEVYKHQVWM